MALVHQQVLQTLASVHDLCSIPHPNGAFYVFLKVKTALKAMTLVEKLIQDHGVAVIPGDTFGTNDGCYLRVAYGALAKEQVAEGMGRLTQGLRALL